MQKVRKKIIHDNFFYKNLYDKNLSKVLNFKYKNIAKTLLLEVKNNENVDLNFSVDIIFVDSKQIKDINFDFRNINETTDVLSFPNFNFTKPSKFKKNEINDLINIIKIKNENYFFLGTVIINIDRVFSQSKKYFHSVKREFSFLLLHSYLHLFGYDHMNIKDETIMINKQNKILNNLKIIR